MDPELLFKVPPGLDREDGENTGVRFLTEHILGPLGGATTFEEHKGPEDFLLFVMELLQDQADIERAGVQKCTAVMTFSAEVWKAGELGMCSSHRQNGGVEIPEEMVQAGEVCLVQAEGEG